MNPAMLPTIHNLYESSGVAPARELTDRLVAGSSFRLERIESNQASSGEGFWYDQQQAEWVALIRGRATLRFEPGGTLVLHAGDCLTIPAHHRHRVESTSADAVWLAMFYDPDDERENDAS